jgi:hypothetical protein
MTSFRESTCRRRAVVNTLAPIPEPLGHLIGEYDSNARDIAHFLVMMETFDRVGEANGGPFYSPLVFRTAYVPDESINLAYAFTSYGLDSMGVLVYAPDRVPPVKNETLEIDMFSWWNYVMCGLTPDALYSFFEEGVSDTEWIMVMLITLAKDAKTKILRWIAAHECEASTSLRLGQYITFLLNGQNAALRKKTEKPDT